MTDRDAQEGGAPGESKEERINRELIELLNELRVALPGVQVLFAFLLAVPFTQRFERLTDGQEFAFFVALLCTTAGSALLISPSAYHRLRFRERDKEQMLRTANRLAIVGTIFLAIAMTSAVYLVTDLVFQATFTVIVTALTAATFAWFWYGLALVRKAQD
jgi:predicted membrane channel-forming protein YqfA (hemolysin III family)